MAVWQNRTRECRHLRRMDIFKLRQGRRSICLILRSVMMMGWVIMMLLMVMMTMARGLRLLSRCMRGQLLLKINRRCRQSDGKLITLRRHKSLQSRAITLDQILRFPRQLNRVTRNQTAPESQGQQQLRLPRCLLQDHLSPHSQLTYLVLEPPNRLQKHPNENMMPSRISFSPPWTRYHLPPLSIRHKLTFSV